MTRGDLARWLARPVLFVCWAFVAWGHLMLLALLWTAAVDGPGPALEHLLADRGAVWTWLNAGSAALALLLWLAAGLLFAGRRRARVSGAQPRP